jgi:hypothetical protein
VAALALAVVAIAVVVVSRGAGPRRPPPAPDPAAAADPRAAYARAIELGQSKRFVASLPWFRRASEGIAGDWEVHYNRATALYQASIEVRTHRGSLGSATSSSWERVAWTREALAEMATAERLAPGDEMRVRVATTRAQRLQVWGLPWDAVAGFRGAARFDPGWEKWARSVERTLEDPRVAPGAAVP